MGTESGERTGNMTGGPPTKGMGRGLGPESGVPSPWTDKQTIIIAFPTSDAGCKYGKYWGGGRLQSQIFPQISGSRSFLAGTPVPGSFQGLWSQVLFRGAPVPARGYPSASPRQNGRASTCYTAGGKPLRSRRRIFLLRN